MLRIINRLLCFLAILGCFFASRAADSYLEARESYQQIAIATGPFEITDPSKVHFKLVPTDSRFDFHWYVYVPANHKCAFRIEQPNESIGGGCSSPDPMYGSFRVRIREVDGEVKVYCELPRGSSKTYSYTRDAVQLDKLQIHVVDHDGIIALADDESLELINVQFFEPPSDRYRFVAAGPDCYRLVAGPSIEKILKMPTRSP